MSARFELEAMRIALGEMLARIDRIEEEVEKVKVEGEGEGKPRTDSRIECDFSISGECPEAPSVANGGNELSAISGAAGGAV